MKRKKETIVNFIVGILSQSVLLVFGLIVPRIIMTSYGSDTNGLMTSITQVFTYVALLESGISLATRNALFKPMVEKKQDDINLIISSSKHYYRIITYIYLGVVLVLSITLPFAFKTQVDYWTIFFVTLFEGLTSAVSLYFVDTDICFLNACGKAFVVNIVEFVYKTIGFAVKIILALNGINIAFIQVMFFVNVIIKVIVIKIYMKKKYPEIVPIKTKNYYKFSDRTSYLITEIAWVIFSSTDMIVLSIFLSTSMSSVYSIYNMIFLSLSTVVNSVYNALSYMLGNCYHKDIEQYKKLHNTFTSFIMTITTIFMCVGFMLAIPFVRLYTSGVDDVNYIYDYLPLLFALVQMLSWSRYVSGNLTSVAGYAKITSRISIVEAFINITTSIVLVHFLGIYGVLIATVVALPLKVIFTNVLSEKVILKRKPWRIIVILCSNYIVFAGAFVFDYFIKIKIETYGHFVLYGFLLTAIFSVIVITINVIANPNIKDIVKLFLHRNKEVEQNQ